MKILLLAFKKKHFLPAFFSYRTFKIDSTNIVWNFIKRFSHRNINFNAFVIMDELFQNPVSNDYDIKFIHRNLFDSGTNDAMQW